MNYFFASLMLGLNLFNFEDNTYYNMSANPIIVDMDFCTDVDDAVALRLATDLDQMGVGSLVAIGLCTTDKDGTDINVKAAHGILVSDGMGDVPIGTAEVVEPDESPYWGICAELSNDSLNVLNAVDLYKLQLKSCANEVTIVTTGYLTNIEYLLRDEEGFELVRDNCKRIVVVGGDVPEGKGNNFSFTRNAARAAKYVNENAPCEVVYVPSDVGGVFNAGQIIQRNNPDDIVAKSITAFGSTCGRVAWDPTGVLIAFLPEAHSNFDFIRYDVSFDEDGTCHFAENVDGKFKVVRRKASVTNKQYEQMLEGILGYDYLTTD